MHAGCLSGAPSEDAAVVKEKALSLVVSGCQGLVVPGWAEPHMGRNKPPHTKVAETKMDQYTTPRDMGPGPVQGAAKEAEETPTHWILRHF
ncbi:hypothetical protein NDU88_005468 [Pleurodeles waltl]|uniref:Uncharacterized protein n=1 Tax=Pleurodeles waltl TaxID=8319 RepID=A0AAV7RL42_PLEWA|nr:hypothetical protein NDU88_005468 [Pleurodeles waltl]